MQLATVEFARNVVGLKDAHSAELDPNTPYQLLICYLNKKISKI